MLHPANLPRVWPEYVEVYVKTDALTPDQRTRQVTWVIMSGEVWFTEFWTRYLPTIHFALVDRTSKAFAFPILVRHDVPGFVGNRLQFAVLREALHILLEGIASAEDIDAAMTAGPGLRYGLLGPLRMADLGGLDVFLAISTYLFPELSSDTKPPGRLADLVKEGKLGVKTGGGLYEYGEEALSEIIAQRDRVLLGFLKVLKEEASPRNTRNTRKGYKGSKP